MFFESVRMLFLKTANYSQLLRLKTHWLPDAQNNLLSKALKSLASTKLCL